MTNPALELIPPDLVQQTREAIVAILDTHALVAALTGRGDMNIVAWGDLTPDTVLPVLAYHVIDSGPGRGVGLTAIDVQFTAVAATEQLANQLVAVVPMALTPVAFAALTRPLDAVLQYERTTRRSVPFDPSVDAARADLDVTLHVAG